MVKRPRRQLGPDELSRSELAILHLLANGRDPYQLAAELGLTRNTVQVHRNRAYRKLGAVDLTGAVLAALQAGVMRPDAIVTGPHRHLPQIAAAQATLDAVHVFADGLETGGYPHIAAQLRRILTTS